MWLSGAEDDRVLAKNLLKRQNVSLSRGMNLCEFTGPRIA
jgi:hypothetical protein